MCSGAERAPTTIFMQMETITQRVQPLLQRPQWFFFQKWFKGILFTQYSIYSRLQLYKCIDIYFCNFDLYFLFYIAFGSNIFSIKLFGNRFKYLKSIDLFIASDNEFLISFHNSIINFFKQILPVTFNSVKTMEFIQNSCTVHNKICRYFGG